MNANKRPRMAEERAVSALKRLLATGQRKWDIGSLARSWGISEALAKNLIEENGDGDD